jgi:hypothetical protein
MNRVERSWRRQMRRRKEWWLDIRLTSGTLLRLAIEIVEPEEVFSIIDMHFPGAKFLGIIRKG